jgi:hypothetical protein
VASRAARDQLGRTADATEGRHVYNREDLNRQGLARGRARLRRCFGYPFVRDWDVPQLSVVEIVSSPRQAIPKSDRSSVNMSSDPTARPPVSKPIRRWASPRSRKMAASTHSRHSVPQKRSILPKVCG